MARDRTIDEPTSHAVARASEAGDVPGDASEEDRRAFSEGDLVGRRYRIVKFLAAGGMGEVYEANDEELGGTLALKAMRGERSADARAVERFRREISFARRITHPNVARFFDVGFHRDESAQRTVAFLTMELLAGETLSERLARGRLTEEEALPLATQIAAALDAAHAAGVVHRDLKSSNVMLVPTAEGSVRGVVTDFGLARLAESPDHSLSRDVELLGSPPYMAPEQVQGGEITPQTDVYSFGIVLYEAMTGELPFVSESPMTTALMRLTRMPKNPRELAPSLDARWEFVILKCLEREPANRFARAGDVAAALVSHDVPAGRWRRSSRRLRVLFGVVGVVSAIALVAGSTRLNGVGKPQSSAHATTLAGSEVRRSIAVLGFKGSGAEHRWIDQSLVQQMSTLLAAGDSLRVVSAARVAAARHESGFDDTFDVDAPAVVARVRDNVRAERTVTGTYDVRGNTLQLDVAVKEGADTIAAARVKGTVDALPELATRITKELRTKLGVREPSLEEMGYARAALPSVPEAARLYAQGMFEQQRFQYESSRSLLRKATDAAPDFAPAYAALATAVGGTGRDEEAARLAEKARALSGGLSRPDRLSIEADYHRLRSDFERAASVYQALFTFYPDEVEYGVNLMRSQTKAGRPLDALATVGELRKLPAGLRDDPRIDFEEARAAHVSSNYPLCLAAAIRALEEGKRRGNIVLVGQAGYFYGIALDALGKPVDAKKALLAAREASKSIGDAYNLGILQSPLHGFHLAHGELAEARKEMVEVENSLSAMGQTYYAASSRLQIANLDYLEGNTKVAKETLEEAIATLRRVNGTHALGGALPELGEMLAREGKFEEAKRACEEALTITRKAGRKAAEANALLTLALIARLERDPKTARKYDEAALALERAAAHPAGIATALVATAEREELERDFTRARVHAEEGLESMTKLGDELAAAEAKIVLSRIAFAEAKYPEAETLATEAESRLKVAGARTAETRATAARSKAIAARTRSGGK